MPAFEGLKRNMDRIFSPQPFQPAKGEIHGTTVLGAGPIEYNIPKHVWEVLVQAVDGDIRYTLDGTPPTISSGFKLINGNDPIAIPVIPGRTVLIFIREDVGAVLELMAGH